MRLDQYLEETKSVLKADGSLVSRVELPIGSAIVGLRSEFRWRWFATKLHTFTVVVPLPLVTATALEEASSQAIDHALAVKGRFRGLQTGVAAIPVLVGEQVSPDGLEALRQRPGRRWASLVLPAIVDIEHGILHRYKGRQIWGGLYTDWLNSRLDVLPNPV